ncbi:hypothetical protein ACHWQZ_G005624 [Mnemiopsis leidyi]
MKLYFFTASILFLISRISATTYSVSIKKTVMKNEGEPHQIREYQVDFGGPKDKRLVECIIETLGSSNEVQTCECDSRKWKNKPTAFLSSLNFRFQQNRVYLDGVYNCVYQWEKRSRSDFKF